MKFIGFKEFRFRSDLGSVVEYLSIELKKILRDLQLGLNELSFQDNFKSFTTTVEIGAGVEVAIRHDLRVVPRYRVILRSNSHEITDGDTPWDVNFVFLKNNGASSASVTVVFLA